MPLNFTALNSAVDIESCRLRYLFSMYDSNMYVSEVAMKVMKKNLCKSEREKKTLI